MRVVVVVVAGDFVVARVAAACCCCRVTIRCNRVLADRDVKSFMRQTNCTCIVVVPGNQPCCFGPLADAVVVSSIWSWGVATAGVVAASTLSSSSECCGEDKSVEDRDTKLVSVLAVVDGRDGRRMRWRASSSSGKRVCTMERNPESPKAEKLTSMERCGIAIGVDDVVVWEWFDVITVVAGFSRGASPRETCLLLLSPLTVVVVVVVAVGATKEMCSCIAFANCSEGTLGRKDKLSLMWRILVLLLLVGPLSTS